MKKRDLCRITALCGIASLSGCLTASESIGDVLREDIDEEAIEVNYSTNSDGDLEVETHQSITEIGVIQNEETKTTLTERAGSNYTLPIATCDRENDIEPGPVIFEHKERGEIVTTTQWRYEPEIAISDFQIASITNYNPLGYPQESTPVITLEHTTSGAVCITGVEIANPSTKIGTENGEQTPMMKTGHLDTDDESDLNEKSSHRNSWILTDNRTLSIAIDGLFTHNAEEDNIGEPEEKDEINQEFDLIIHTNNAGELTIPVEVLMTNGIEEWENENFPWTHRFSTIRALSTGD